MEPDLPEPKQPLYTPEEKRQRKWNVYLTFLYVVSGYSLLHKVVIPLLLKFTRLADSPYARIDLGALLPVALLIGFRQRRLNAFGSFLAGAGIAYGVAETYWIATNHYQGWLAISRFLSSTPLSLICIILLTDADGKRNARSAWSGALLVATLFFFELGNSHLPDSPKASVASVTQAHVSDESCGPQKLSTLLPAPPMPAVLKIEQCGFFPRMSTVTLKTVIVENTLSTPVNVHLILSKGEGAPRPGGNWMISGAGTLEIQLPNLAPGEMGMWYSDTHPKMGVGAIVPQDGNKIFELTRNPISIRKLP